MINNKITSLLLCSAILVSTSNSMNSIDINNNNDLITQHNNNSVLQNNNLNNNIIFNEIKSQFINLTGKINNEQVDIQKLLDKSQKDINDSDKLIIDKNIYINSIKYNVINIYQNYLQQRTKFSKKQINDINDNFVKYINSVQNTINNYNIIDNNYNNYILDTIYEYVIDMMQNNKKNNKKNNAIMLKVKQLQSYYFMNVIALFVNYDKYINQNKNSEEHYNNWFVKQIFDNITSQKIKYTQTNKQNNNVLSQIFSNIKNRCDILNDTYTRLNNINMESNTFVQDYKLQCSKSVVEAYYLNDRLNDMLKKINDTKYNFDDHNKNIIKSIWSTDFITKLSNDKNYIIKCIKELQNNLKPLLNIYNQAELISDKILRLKTFGEEIQSYTPGCKLLYNKINNELNNIKVIKNNPKIEGIFQDIIKNINEQIDNANNIINLNRSVMSIEFTDEDKKHISANDIEFINEIKKTANSNIEDINKTIIPNYRKLLINTFWEKYRIHNDNYKKLVNNMIQDNTALNEKISTLSNVSNKDGYKHIKACDQKTIKELCKKLVYNITLQIIEVNRELDTSKKIISEILYLHDNDYDTAKKEWEINNINLENEILPGCNRNLYKVTEILEKINNAVIE